MKILLISENGGVVETLQKFCDKNGYCLITYNMPLKALDNLTEVAPDFIAINATDFPRHWKIVAQYLNASSEYSQIKKILLDKKDFSKTDLQKAEFLKVSPVLYNDTEELFLKLVKICKVFFK